MKLEEISTHYDRAASRYDWLTELVFGRLLRIERYRQLTMGLLGELDGATVLDIGCGTGRNFAGLVTRVGMHGHVIGLDYSQGMLAQARRRIARHGWQNVSLVRSDAVKLSGITQAVDAVIAVWCYGIVYDLQAALHRALDVLRPGGRIAILDFARTRPDQGPLRRLYPVYAYLLRVAGIDTREDLDDARLQARWTKGRQYLQGQLDEWYESHYLGQLGTVYAGRKPQRV